MSIPNIGYFSIYTIRDDPLISNYDSKMIDCINIIMYQLTGKLNYYHDIKTFDNVRVKSELKDIIFNSDFKNFLAKIPYL